MHRWYMSLPKYAKDSKKAPDGGKLRKDYQEMMKLFKQNVNGNELLFEKLPKAFGLNEFHESLADNITSAKEYYDSYLSKVKKALRDEIKNIFAIQDLAPQVHRMSLSSVIKDWCESIDRSAFEQLFADGTDRCLGLFKNISNDDDATISRLAKLSTDLRFSNADETHIKNISAVLPEVANQVIMFVMEKDWQYAESVMSSRVGKYCKLKKFSESHTEIEE